MNSKLRIPLCWKGVEGWVLTDRANPAAMQLYQKAGGVERPEETVMYTFKLSENDGAESTRLSQ